jgi:hypothetical protein
MGLRGRQDRTQMRHDGTEREALGLRGRQDETEMRQNGTEMRQDGTKSSSLD